MGKKEDRRDMSGKVYAIHDGYFFIRGDDGSNYFGTFHDVLKTHTGCRPDVHVSSRLSFDITDEGKRNLKAVNIQVLQE